MSGSSERHEPTAEDPLRIGDDIGQGQDVGEQGAHPFNATFQSTT